MIQQSSGLAANSATVRGGIAAMTASPARLTPIQWLVCAVAALGFAFDLYEIVVLPLVLRPALAALGNLESGTPEFNRWAGLFFFVPAVAGEPTKFPIKNGPEIIDFRPFCDSR